MLVIRMSLAGFGSAQKVEQTEEPKNRSARPKKRASRSICMPKKRKKTKAKEELRADAAAEAKSRAPREEPWFHFNQVSKKKVVVRFVVEATETIEDVITKKRK